MALAADDAARSEACADRFVGGGWHEHPVDCRAGRTLIYPDWRNAALAPGYDFVSTIVYMPDERMALNFARTKRFADVSNGELSYLAAKARLPEKLVTQIATETVERFRATWKARKGHLGLPAKTIGLIDEHIQSVPIAYGK